MNKDGQSKLIENINIMMEDESKRERRKRRTAVEIVRKYICKFRGCSKSYGSEGSLNQHMKNKHNEFYLQYIESLGLGSNEGNLKAYESISSASADSVVSVKKRERKEEMKKNEEDSIGNKNDSGSLQKKTRK